MSDAVDGLYLQAAIELAQRGLFTTTPNPRVGALLVKDGVVIGRGWHQRAGGSHAEAAALLDARAQASAAGLSAAQCAGALRGATAYVSLEPCAFHGRTPPCSQALIDAGCARVVGAMTDPHPQVAGQGYAQLQAAGIEVRRCELSAAQALNAGYALRLSRGRPLVRLKMAASIDGRTAMASGESQWITGPDARRDVQYWRARSCAVITGRGTVAADDPQLNVRDDRFADADGLRQPLRVVLDSKAALRPGAKVFEPPAQALWVHGAQATAPAAAVPTLACGAAQIDLPALLSHLGAAGCNEVLVEAGPALCGAFLAAGLWDEALVYLAPRWLGSRARPLADLAFDHMAQSIEATMVSVTSIGADLRVQLRPE